MPGASLMIRTALCYIAGRGSVLRAGTHCARLTPVCHCTRVLLCSLVSFCLRFALQAYGVMLGPGPPCLVTELMRGGDLYHALRNHPALMK